MRILVVSCDKNKDLFYPFYYCLEKYWPDHPEVIYSTESILNPYYKTICLAYDLNSWTRRVRETVEKIDDDYILLLVDDIFIRERVDNNKVLSLCSCLKDNYANINLQLNGDNKSKEFKNDILERGSSQWSLCCMCTLWQKKAMLDLFDYDTDPRSFEINNYTKDYKFLISKYGNIINWGRKSNKEWHFGLMKGKWDPECIRFFIKEGLDKDIDFLERGVWYSEQKYHFMQLAGDCSCLGYLGLDRIRGPVDNVLTKGYKCIEKLINDLYYDEICNTKPDLYKHKKYFKGDIETTYDYPDVQIIHNDPLSVEYLQELKARCIVFKDFYKKVISNDNYYFTINFNSFDVDKNNNEINNNINKTINYLKEKDILDKTIFIGLRATEEGRGNKHPNNIEYYKKLYNIRYIEIINNDIWTSKLIDNCYKQFITKLEDIQMSKLKKAFGIVSYFPWSQPERKERQDRLDRLVNQLSDLWPDVPILVIAQQWKFYTLEGKCKNKVIRYDYDKLGILKARNVLRKHFLEDTDFDYLIMFDDDAIIRCEEEGVAEKYMQTLDENPEGFCFIKGKGSSPYTDYNDSQLNLCAISRWIYEREPLPNIDPQKSEGFEDRIWSTLLHYKYADKEFNAPKFISCIHFKNPNETAPSTWSSEKQYNWRQLRQNTIDIEEYISEHKELPDKWKAK